MDEVQVVEVNNNNSISNSSSQNNNSFISKTKDRMAEVGVEANITFKTQALVINHNSLKNHSLVNNNSLKTTMGLEVVMTKVEETVAGKIKEFKTSHLINHKVVGHRKEVLLQHPCLGKTLGHKLIQHHMGLLKVFQVEVDS